MGIPEFVAESPTQTVRTYASAPWRHRRWRPDRPGDLAGRQPIGPRLGYPGPDPGYASTLAEDLASDVRLQSGESLADALAVGAAVGARRASVFGRAPVLDDVMVGLAVWGFLTESPDPDLLSERRAYLDGVHHAHAYDRLRAAVDAVKPGVLRPDPDDIIELASADWRSVLDL